MIEYLMGTSVNGKTSSLWTLCLSCKHQYSTGKKAALMEHDTKLIQLHKKEEEKTFYEKY